MVKVSIIVPVYNVEDYLEKCLASLINQTLKEIEIIVVNDGSTDGSQEIIDRYSNLDNRIISLKKENGGLSDARNYALPYVKGEYIGFVDSDDYVDINMYEEMYLAAKKENYDLVECDFIWEFPNKQVHDESNIVDNPLVDIRVVAWNKLYKTSLIKKSKITFPVGLRYEDVAFCYQLLPHVKNIGYVKGTFYHYMQRETSIANTQNEKVGQLYDILRLVLDYYKKNKLKKKYYAELEYIFIRYIFGRSFYRITCIKDKKVRKRLLDEGYSLLTNEFPAWKNNTYLRTKKGIKNFYYRHMNPFIYKASSCFFSLFGNFIINLSMKWR